MRLLIACALSLFSTLSFADIQVLAVENYSTIQNFPPIITTNNGTATTSTITINGGLAGAEDGECPSTTSVCNSCNGAKDVCNYRRISPNLDLVVTLISKGTNAKSGIPIVTNALKTASFPITNSVSTAWPANSSFSFKIKWSQICSAIGDGNTDCKIDKTGTVYFGFDSDGGTVSCDDCTAITFNVMSSVTDSLAATSEVQNCANGTAANPREGICDFSIQSADSRAILKSTGPSTFPNASVTNSSETVTKNFHSIRLLCKQGTALTTTDTQTTVQANFDALSIQSNHYCGDIGLDENGDQTSSEISGLENGKTYYFRTAMTDLAGNMSNYSATTAVLPNADTTCTPASNFTCHVATPDKIYGILSKDQNCFIATAAYGSPFRHEVAELRWFRDRVLSTHVLGRKLTQIYYKLSPPFAQYIAQHSWARRTAQIGLIPVWTFAYGLRNPLVCLVVFMTVGASLIFYRRLKLSKR